MLEEKKTIAVKKVIAISVEEVRLYGCPYCGFRSATSPLSDGSTAIRICGECGKGFVVLAKGLTRSTIGFGEDGSWQFNLTSNREIDGAHYPEIQPHPRRGIPAHGKPDKRPVKGGEYFWSRGIGRDITPGCFICGGPKGVYHNIAAFVQCKESGERIVALFKTGAWLDFRPRTPDYVQVKIGACDAHLQELQLLEELCMDGVISKARISTATWLTETKP